MPGIQTTASQWCSADDAALLAGCTSGSQLAWSELVDRYSRLVYSIARKFGLVEGEADDVFQSVFAALLRNVERITQPERLSSWLLTTARRECLRTAKAARRPAPLLDDELRSTNARNASDSHLEDQHLVRTAMARLDERDRVLLTELFRSNGPTTYESIADRLGIPIGSIGPTRARAFKRLERILHDLGFEARPPRGSQSDVSRRMTVRSVTDAQPPLTGAIDDSPKTSYVHRVCTCGDAASSFCGC